MALVGYTNAGKSTLMNALTAAGVLAEDRLFATLDPTARTLRLPDGREVLLVDTVGLVRRLPHQLVEAFHSTLEEAAQADADTQCVRRLQLEQNGGHPEAVGGPGISRLVVVMKKC